MHDELITGRCLKSDHKLITFDLGTVKNTETWERWNFKAVDWKKWETKCDIAFEGCFLEIVSESDVDKIYSVMFKVILDKAEEIIPKKKICSQKFWSIINKGKKDITRSVVQSNKRQDGSYAVEDLEIVREMKEHYGKESLDVKDQKSLNGIIWLKGR